MPYAHNGKLDREIHWNDRVIWLLAMLRDRGHQLTDEEILHATGWSKGTLHRTKEKLKVIQHDELKQLAPQIRSDIMQEAYQMIADGKANAMVSRMVGSGENAMEVEVMDPTAAKLRQAGLALLLKLIGGERQIDSPEEEDENHRNPHALGSGNMADALREKIAKATAIMEADLVT